jgi:exoribonuclease R
MQAHRLTGTPIDVGALCAEMQIDAAFSAEVQAAAEEAAKRPLPDLPDATDVPLVTIDPPGSLDLDQAVAIETRADGGWVVSYAIADVGAFVDAGGPVDVEARRRGETLYAPDRRIPLSPDALGEGAMSLLPDQERPALLWRIEVDPDGSFGTYGLRRAIVRSRAKLDYPSVQQAADAGTLPDAIAALPAFGKAHHARGLANGAIELNLPEQQVDEHDGTWSLAYRSPLPVELWNSQVSLLTGAVAARIMLDGRIGLLRTLPPAPEWIVERLRKAAPALGVTWPDGASPGQVMAPLDLTDPRHVAFVDLASELLRGAGYSAFDGALPEVTVHAGIGGPYAHVTAPIRRLCDRFANEVCVALAGGTEVPTWARVDLPEVADLMAASGKCSHAFDRAIVDGTEACLLRDRVGQTFDAVIVDVDHRNHGTGGAKGNGDARADASTAKGAATTAGATEPVRAEPARTERGTVMLDGPAVTARVDGTDLPLGSRVPVRLETADPSTRTVRFTYPA